MAADDAGIDRTEAPPAEVSRVRTPSGLSKAWCVSGGAPLVGLPVLDEKERVYAATSDGYLHAFQRDGRFRWSYTVKGTPMGSVSLRASDGVILMGTTARMVYAINQSGQRHWSFQTLSPVWSGLFALESQAVVFLGQDRRLYALANGTGGALYRVRAPGEPMGGPIVGKKDVVWLALTDGVARFQSALRLERFPLDGPVEQLVAWGDRAVAISGGSAYLIASDTLPRQIGAARYVQSDGHQLVLVDQQGGLRLLNSTDSSHLSVPTLEDPAIAALSKLSAPPALVNEELWVPQEDGKLTIIQLSRRTQRSIQISPRPLASPVVGVSGRRGLVADSDGTFCALDLTSR